MKLGDKTYLTQIRILLITTVFLFIFFNSFSQSQSKKEQIEILILQKDSINKLVIDQKLQIEQLNRKIDLVCKEQLIIKDEKQILNNQLKLKEKELENVNKQLLKPKECLAAKIEITIIFDESTEDPTIEKRALFNGFELINNQDGFNNTYPNRLYGFQYKLIDSDEFIPGGLLFNERLPELEKKLNKIVKTELLKNGVLQSEIVNYSFSKKMDDDFEGKINFFIEFDKVTFYLEQYMYGQINDRFEIEYSLSEIYPYLSIHNNRAFDIGN
jgi:hypothetical protein